MEKHKNINANLMNEGVFHFIFGKNNWIFETELGKHHTKEL